MENQAPNKIKSISSSEGDDCEQYSILNWIEKHETIFVALLTSVLAIFSIYANILAYAYQILRFQEWNVSIELIDTFSAGKVFYNIVALLILSIANMVIYEYLNTKIFRHLIVSKLINNKKKRWKEIEKTLNEAKKQMEKTDKQSNNHHEELQNSLDIIQSEFMKIKKNLKQFKMNSATYLLDLFLFVAIPFFPISFFYQTITGMRFMSALVGSLLSIVVIFVISYVNSNRIAAKYDIEAIGEEIRNGVDFDETLSKHIPKDKLTFPKGRENFCNSKIRDYAQMIVILNIAITFALIPLSKTESIFMKEFGICSYSQQQYAVVYQSKDILVLKEAEINGENIIINIDKQLVIKNEDIDIEFHKFSIVARYTNSDE